MRPGPDWQKVSISAFPAPRQSDPGNRCTGRWGLAPPARSPRPGTPGSRAADGHNLGPGSGWPDPSRPRPAAGCRSPQPAGRFLAASRSISVAISALTRRSACPVRVGLLRADQATVPPEHDAGCDPSRGRGWARAQYGDLGTCRIAAAHRPGRTGRLPAPHSACQAGPGHATGFSAPTRSISTSTVSENRLASVP